MRHTILIATLSAVVASVVTTAVISGSLFGAGTANSANAPNEVAGAISPGGVEGLIQGDVDCGKNVTPVDSLKVLRHDAGLSVQQDEPCPDIGTLAAIPGPPGVVEIEIVTEQSSTDSEPKAAVASCPEGKRLLGGGGESSLSSVPLTLTRPISGTDWISSASEVVETDAVWSVTAYAVCATVAEEHE